MESRLIKIGRYSIKCYNLNTLIIGSGAASLNAVLSLHMYGQKDIVIATSQWYGGTSNNAGSDKQTYYKLSLCGSEPDSVRVMAQDLFNGKCIHGDIALCEAQGSVQAFMKLVNLGVPFPRDKFGSWVGYRTDHDNRSRATSAGPNTSKMMFRVLAEEVGKRKIKILNNHQVIELLTDREKSRVIGALAINLKIKDPSKAFVLFNSVNIVLGTGGPGDMYSESVYPISQTGSIGIAFRAGATGQNLTESQFGIASIKFRWNLSGSYQQVIPRYFSTDINGSDEQEFLNDHFPDYTTLTKAIFLKGYQWPFDPAKVARFGSSLIDLIVYNEKTERGRRIFIDYRRNLSWNGEERFIADKLDPEVSNYLLNSGSMQSTPIERLAAMNTPAVELYREHGIDLANEPLEIGVCAQHNNGGLTGNIWWESDLKHLFPVGEVNGSHGVYRPGGSALNSGQVGSGRAAEFIYKRYNDPVPDMNQFLDVSKNTIKSVLDLADHWLTTGRSSLNKRIIEEIRQRMSKTGSIIRDKVKVSEAAAEAFSLFKNYKEGIGASSVLELAECFRISDNCLAHMLYLEAIRSYIEKKGRSRGSYIIINNEDSALPDVSITGYDFCICRYNREIENGIQEINFKNNKVATTIKKVREIPFQNLWFEKVWKDYIEDNYFDS